MSRLVHLATLVCSFFVATSSSAVVSRWVEATYQRQYDESPPALYRIGFATGEELNARYNSLTYEHFSLYAFVRFQNGGTAFLKTTSPVFVNSPMAPRGFCDAFMIANSIDFVQLNDRNMKRWTIAAKRDFFNWIDPYAAREC